MNLGGHFGLFLHNGHHKCPQYAWVFHDFALKFEVQMDIGSHVRPVEKRLLVR